MQDFENDWLWELGSQWISSLTALLLNGLSEREEYRRWASITWNRSLGCIFLPALSLNRDKCKLIGLLMSFYPAMMFYLIKAMESSNYTLITLKPKQTFPQWDIFTTFSFFFIHFHFFRLSFSLLPSFYPHVFPAPASPCLLLSFPLSLFPHLAFLCIKVFTHNLGWSQFNMYPWLTLI